MRLEPNLWTVRCHGKRATCFCWKLNPSAIGLCIKLSIRKNLTAQRQTQNRGTTEGIHTHTSFSSVSRRNYFQWNHQGEERNAYTRWPANVDYCHPKPVTNSYTGEGCHKNKPLSVGNSTGTYPWPGSPNDLPIRPNVPDVSRVGILKCKILIVLECGVAAEPG